ncbi:hypothetical protein JL722_1054 [Aureococcus anophagefferens]|nr:hypothetical protein JL722_1054 [Aureococcus anophagefferens]
MGTRTAARQPREPFDGIDVGSYSTPRFVDLDGDGDLDLVVGEQDGTLNYYENVGSATLPSYEARTGNENPFDDIDIWNGYSARARRRRRRRRPRPRRGRTRRRLYYFENVGSATSPTFATVAGAASPFDGIDVGDLSAPALADVDGDGDLDLVVGEWDGVLNYYENVGSAASPSFAAATGSTSPFDGIDVDSSSRPAFVDLDGDGDLDLVVGERDGVLYYYENVGSASLPTFAPSPQREPLRRHHGIEVDDYPAPAFVDGDGDGDLDLVLGNNDGTLDYYENILEPPTAAPTTAAPSKTPPPAPVPSPTTAAPSKPPLPTPSPLPPHFVDGSANPFDGINVGYFSTPRFVDLDGDGDLDLVVGEDLGALYYYENVGSAATPSYVAVTGSANPFDGIDVGLYSAPALADVDGDGDLDLVVGEWDGTLYYFENVGSATSPSYAARTGSANPFDGIDVGSDSKPALVDLDGDGDLDLVVGTYVGALYYYENVGSAASPSYAAVTPSPAPSTSSTSVAGARPPPTSTATATSTSSWANTTASSTTTRTSRNRRCRRRRPRRRRPAPRDDASAHAVADDARAVAGHRGSHASPTTPLSPGTADPTPSPTTPAPSPGTADPTPSPTTPAPSPGTADPTPPPTTPGPSLASPVPTPCDPRHAACVGGDGCGAFDSESSCLYAVATDGATCYRLGGCDDDAFPATTTTARL